MTCDTMVLTMSLVCWCAFTSLCGYLYVTRSEALPVITVNAHTDAQP